MGFIESEEQKEGKIEEKQTEPEEPGDTLSGPTNAFWEFRKEKK